MKDPKRDQDAERLRALLTGAAPPGPNDPDRANRVAARGRRDRRRLVTAGVIGAVAAAVIITPQVLNHARTSDMRDNAANQPTATATTARADDGSAAMTATPCPDNPALVPDDGAEQTLPSDADTVRLCGVRLPGEGPTPWGAPQDALTVDTGAFVSAVAALPMADPERCTTIRVAPDPYSFLVGRSGSDDHTVFVTNPCNDIVLDGVAHESGAVLDAFLDALSQQREALKLDANFGLSLSTDERCTQPDDVATQLTRGPRVTADTTFAAFASCNTVASEERLADLNAAWPTSTRDLHQSPPDDVDRCPTADVEPPTVYAVTTWGDVVAFEFQACGNYVVGGYAPGIDPTEPAVSRDMQFLPDRTLADDLHLP
jgi:hypothetical protein